jgi:hypothetical protein
VVRDEEAENAPALIFVYSCFGGQLRVRDCAVVGDVGSDVVDDGVAERSFTVVGLGYNLDCVDRVGEHLLEPEGGFLKFEAERFVLGLAIPVALVVEE